MTLASRVRDGASSPHNGSGDNVARIPSVSSGQGVAPSVKPLRASEVTPTELATALTLLEGERYHGIKPADYIRYLKHRPASTASSSNPSLGDAKKLRGVQAMSALNNDIIHWVKFSVLDPEDVEARASAMLFLINTAEVVLATPIGFFLADIVLGMSSIAQFQFDHCNSERPAIFAYRSSPVHTTTNTSHCPAHPRRARVIARSQFKSSCLPGGIATVP